MDRKKIEVSKETKERIAKTFNVSTRAVEYALNFQRNSRKSFRMRIMAMNNGGKLYEIKEIQQIKVNSNV